MRLSPLLFVPLTLALAPAQDLVSQADLRAGDVQAVWRGDRGLNLRYRGADAFLFIPEEFVVHNTGWKAMPFISSRRRAMARQTGQSLVIHDEDAGFDYTKTITLVGADTVRIVYEYGQTGSNDSFLALGYRPAVPWLDGADFAVSVGKQTQTGLMMGLDYATGGTMQVAGKKIVVIEKARWTCSHVQRTRQIR